MKTALIIGISGQDGTYLAEVLLGKGYRVVGTSRDAQMSHFGSLRKAGVFERIKLESMAIVDFRSVLQILDAVAPDEIYNLAGQSSVSLSFNQPVETFESISIGTLNLLEALRFLRSGARLYNASSSECFGNTNGEPADENTPFRPRSPYGVAKAAAFWEVANYREAYSLFACSGILFNHESPLRPRRFVTQKIVDAACSIAEGRMARLELGNIQIQRDWGWAPEYVQAMWQMLQRDTPDDFVIATGVTSRLEDFVAQAFSAVGLDWRNYVRTDPSLLRPTDIEIGRADPGKAARELGWTAAFTMPDVVRMMVAARQAEGA